MTASKELHISLDRDLSRDEDSGGKREYRVDRLQMKTAMGINFTNIHRLMEDNADARRLRHIVIDGQTPVFAKAMPKSVVVKITQYLKKLDQAQRKAILKVLLASDYVLIHGCPGAGKTWTIVTLIQILYTLGYSVLVTSHTHSAVDNILSKLKEVEGWSPKETPMAVRLASQEQVEFLRVGRTGRVRDELLPYTAEVRTRSIKSVAELEAFYSKYQIVACTCLGMNHAVFSRRTFDVCIVDEASQVLQPSSLGPLFCSKKFILVGDSKQLSPVVRDKVALSLGMDESLFSRLEKVCTPVILNYQYRMNSEIMELANKLCYDGALVCGSKEVADCFLPELTPKTPQVEGSLWKLLLQPRPAVVFYDTSKMATLEEQIDSSVRNSTEADLVHRMVDLYLECGVPGSSIGVISPYRGQKQELQQRLAVSTVEVNTIDQFQGRDKEIILISLVKTNPSSEEHHILHDWRRINVALTRAKKKLVLVGHATNLRTYPPIAKVLSILPTASIVQVDASALTA